MSSYKFSPAERAAIYTAHGEKCYLCSRALTLKTMQVDHIIPESLVEKKEELNIALKTLGLPSSFNINSFENWMPACAPCNGIKSNVLFNISPIVQIVLQKAMKKAAVAAQIAGETISDRKIANALNVLERALDDGKLDDETIQTISEFISINRQPELINEPIRLTPLYEILSEKNGLRILRGPYGVGGRPSVKNADSSFDCPNCGPIAAWNGARCVICGALNDD